MNNTVLLFVNSTNDARIVFNSKHTVAPLQLILLQKEVLASTNATDTKSVSTHMRMEKEVLLSLKKEDNASWLHEVAVAKPSFVKYKLK